MVVILPEAQYEEWLDAPAQHSMDFMRQYPGERFLMTPEPLPPKTPKEPKALRAKKAEPPPQTSLF